MWPPWLRNHPADWAPGTLDRAALQQAAATLRAEGQEDQLAQWVALLEHKAVPCGPINAVDQAFADAQVVARSLKVNQPLALESINSTAITSIASVASPLRMVDTPPVLHRPPPALGEHTDAVLAELKLDGAAIAALRQAGVV